MSDFDLCSESAFSDSSAATAAAALATESLAPASLRTHASTGYSGANNETMASLVATVASLAATVEGMRVERAELQKTTASLTASVASMATTVASLSATVEGMRAERLEHEKGATALETTAPVAAKIGSAAKDMPATDLETTPSLAGTVDLVRVSLERGFEEVHIKLETKLADAVKEICANQCEFNAKLDKLDAEGLSDRLNTMTMAFERQSEATDDLTAKINGDLYTQVVDTVFAVDSLSKSMATESAHQAIASQSVGEVLRSLAVIQSKALKTLDDLHNKVDANTLAITALGAKRDAATQAFKEQKAKSPAGTQLAVRPVQVQKAENGRYGFIPGPKVVSPKPETTPDSSPPSPMWFPRGWGQ